MTDADSFSIPPRSISSTAVEKFYALIESDPKLQERIVDADLDGICAIAGEFGIEIGPSQLLEYSEEVYADQELSNSELATAAGGGILVKSSAPDLKLELPSAGLKLKLPSASLKLKISPVTHKTSK